MESNGKQCKASEEIKMDTILKIKSSAVLNLFRKMTNEQIGKIIRAYLNNNPKDLTDDEMKIYTELTKYREQYKNTNKQRTVKGWETRKANKAKKDKEQSQLQAQLQRDKEEMIKLRAENETLKKSKVQYNNTWTGKYKKPDDISISSDLAATFV